MMNNLGSFWYISHTDLHTFGLFFNLAEDLKRQGIIRHLGFSTHTPVIAEKLINLGMFDLFMFSINAAFDFKKGDYAIGDYAQRENLYRLAQSKEVDMYTNKCLQNLVQYW